MKNSSKRPSTSHVSIAFAEPVEEEENNNNNNNNDNSSSLSSANIFRDRVNSVYERLQEKEENEKQLTLENTVSTIILGSQEEKSTMSHRRRDPEVPLYILERMHLVFELYEWRKQKKIKKSPVYSFDETLKSEEYNNNNDNEENDIAAMLRWKKEQEILQERLRIEREHRPLSSMSNSSNINASAFNIKDNTFQGIPFSVFEKEIVEPFFDFLFPPEHNIRASSLNFMDDLNETINPSVLNINNNKTRSKSRNSLRTSYQRRRASQIEAVENLFCVMDTNGDGLLSWDELTSYILQSGQRLLLAGDYRRGVNVSSSLHANDQQEISATIEENNNSNNNNINRKIKNKGNLATDYAGRNLNFTPTPSNTSPWQQQYPLVRFLYHTQPISHFIFANRGRRYITASWDGLVKLWRPDPRLADNRGKPSIIHERNIFSAGAPIIDIILAPESLGDAEVLAIAAMDGTITLLRMGSGEVLKTFIGRCVPPPGVSPASIIGNNNNNNNKSVIHNSSSNNNNSGNRCVSSTPTHPRKWRREDLIDSVPVANDIRSSLESAAVVMRPDFKVRAYRREALEIFFTDVSRYFIGLDVVPPTYEHLERRRSVKTDILMQFGGDPGVLGSWNKSSSQSWGEVIRQRVNQAFDKEYKKNNEEHDNNNSSDSDDNDDDLSNSKGKNNKSNNNSFDRGENNNSFVDTMETRRKSKKDNKRSISGISTSFIQKRRPIAYESSKCWFARSVALTKYEKTSSSSLLPSGVFLLLGFETGVLQIYQMKAEWFTTSNLSLTRVEPAAMHEPIFTITLHRDAIISIIASEANDLIMTASDDGTVVIRHMSRIQIPFVTLGDGITLPGMPLPLHPSGHTKRITCMCWNATRYIIVTGGIDRFIIFWMPSSSRPLNRIDLRNFSTSSGVTGYPIDLSFLQPPRHPLLLLVLDSKRMLYFIDTVSFQCLHILCDDSPASLRTGNLLRARYDAVEDRLILGGRYIRLWDSQQRDEYPHDYCGHRRPIIGLAFQQKWEFWVSADDSVIIIWNAEVADLQLRTLEEQQEEDVMTEKGNDDKDKKKNNKQNNISSRVTSRSNSTNIHNTKSNINNNNNNNNNSMNRYKSKGSILNDGCRWALATVAVRSWRVEGGICSLAIDQSESSHTFVALLRDRRILEYNSFSGSPLRSFEFPTHMTEISSLDCSMSGAGASSLLFMRPISFLCGTFEREQSLNGTTALYTLSSQSDSITSNIIDSSSCPVHRKIITNKVGASCAIIESTLGLVVIGHRGGVSVTPVDEATTCPIACLRLTDGIINNNNNNGKKELMKKTGVLFGPESVQKVGGPPQIISTNNNDNNSNATTIPGVHNNSSNNNNNNIRGITGRRSMNIPDVQQRMKMHCRPSPPLDFVALFPGPLLHDPVPLTRECMQQRERYLFYEEQTLNETGEKGKEGGATSSQAPSTNPINKSEEGEYDSKSDGLPPLLLFSEEFIASDSEFGSTFGVFLREQLHTLGFVERIISIKETGYVISGSDDGLLQFWNLRTMSEVMRCRVTFTLDAITSMDVKNGNSHIVIGDANGYIILIDINEMNWMSPMPLEMINGVENGVKMINRWRGHKQGVTSVCFINKTQNLDRKGTFGAFAIHRSLHVLTPTSITNSAQQKAKTTNRTQEEKEKEEEEVLNTFDNDINQEPLFICTSGEDSYIYSWCWEPATWLGGSFYCIGCFGGGVEAPPRPPIDKLTDNASRVLDIIRKIYISEKMLIPGGVLSGSNALASIHSAVIEIIEEMRLVKSENISNLYDSSTVAATTTTNNNNNNKNISYLGEKANSRRVSTSHMRSRTRSRTRSRGMSSLFPDSFKSNNNNNIHNNCPRTFVLAFEEGMYYDRSLVELIERLLGELRGIHKDRRSTTNIIETEVNTRKSNMSTVSGILVDKQGNIGNNMSLNIPTGVESTTIEARRFTLFPSLGNTNTTPSSIDTQQSIIHQGEIASSPSSLKHEIIIPPHPPPSSTSTSTNITNTNININNIPSFTEAFNISTEKQQQQQSSSSPSSSLPQTARPIISKTAQLFKNSDNPPRLIGNETESETFTMAFSSATETAQISSQRSRNQDDTSPSSTTILTITRPDSAEEQSNNNKNNIIIMGEDFELLPPITVCYASPTPLPRLRRKDNNNNPHFISNKNKNHSISDTLPLLSQVIGLPDNTSNIKLQQGVKILMKERVARRSCHSFFLKEYKEENILNDIHKYNPKHLNDARRDRKRKSALWGPARVMGTLMRWKAPRKASFSTKTTSSSLLLLPPRNIKQGENCESTRVGSASSNINNTNNNDNNNDDNNSATTSSEKSFMTLPVFIPLRMGSICGEISPMNMQLSQTKSVGLTLKEEMEAMKNILQVTLREKQVLLAQERQVSGGRRNTVGR